MRIGNLEGASPSLVGLLLATWLATLSIAAPCGAQIGDIPGKCVVNCDSILNPSSRPQQVDLTRTFALDRVEFRGEFYAVTSDGRKLIGQNAAQVALDNNAHLVTGPSGHARLTLPDGTTFTLGAGTEVVLDRFVYDPDTSFRSIVTALVKGHLRWVTGKIGRRGETRVTLPAGYTGIRGTDFECSASPDGSGYVKLFSGALTFTPYDTGPVIDLAAGQMITYTGFTEIHGPMTLPPGDQDEGPFP